MIAQAPSPAVMFHVSNVGKGETPTTYTVTLSWQNGLVSAENPIAESYTIYRAWGFGVNDSDYTLVGTINTPSMTNSSQWSFMDKEVKKGVHTYYVRGVASAQEGTRSPNYYAVCPSNYCVGPDQRFEFTTTPPTFALPGKTYTYNAVSEHPSVRVWGFIRYAMVEGPEGMTINEKSGELKWDIPQDVSGQITVKITSYMQKYQADTTILYQEWTLRIAEPFEVQQLASSVKEEAVKQVSVFPNPTDSRLHLSCSAESGHVSVSILSMLGSPIMSEARELTGGFNSFDISTSNLPQGTYFIRITSGQKQSILPFVIAR
ncbi:MAG: T9SS type A sorting domain-containing protein [Bacteroidetes bacterium]|nr:T9SS type A sorting domain-containing protein [Bacteroidota bacterium]